MINIANLGENIKNAGLSSGEVSRIRQYERYLGEAIENLRMVKSYRTPQTLRSFARLFTTLLPPFFAPTYAQLAKNVDSLAVGITFAVVTGLCLNALLEGVEILEDPFVAFVTLDGIDVREELKVLHCQQLLNARSYIFPQAMPYGDPRQAAFLFASDLADVELGALEEITIQNTALNAAAPGTPPLIKKDADESNSSGIVHLDEPKQKDEKTNNNQLPGANTNAAVRN